MPHLPTSVPTNKAPEPVGHFPHARRVGDLLFITGVGPSERGTKKIPGVELDEDGNFVSYGIWPQVRSVFQNVRWILEDSSNSWEKIVGVTVYLTNMKDDSPPITGCGRSASRRIRRTGPPLRSTACPRRSLLS